MKYCKLIIGLLHVKDILNWYWVTIRMMGTLLNIDTYFAHCPKWCRTVRIGVAGDALLSVFSWRLPLRFEGVWVHPEVAGFIFQEACPVWGCCLSELIGWKERGVSMQHLSGFRACLLYAISCSMHVCSVIRSRDGCKSSGAQCIHRRAKIIVTLSCIFE